MPANPWVYHEPESIFLFIKYICREINDIGDITVNFYGIITIAIVMTVFTLITVHQMSQLSD
jgi:glycopeptide antibiotics resistance protein